MNWKPKYLKRFAYQGISFLLAQLPLFMLSSYSRQPGNATKGNTPPWTMLVHIYPSLTLRKPSVPGCKCRAHSSSVATLTHKELDRMSHPPQMRKLLIFQLLHHYVLCVPDQEAIGFLYSVHYDSRGIRCLPANGY